MPAEECWDNVPSKNKPIGVGKPCPICGKPALPEMIPFCSKRCADRDLANWATGSYAIATTETLGSEDESDEI